MEAIKRKENVARDDQFSARLAAGCIRCQGIIAPKVCVYYFNLMLAEVPCEPACAADVEGIA